MSHKVVVLMNNEALTLFRKRQQAIRKEKTIIINLYLMVTLQFSTYTIRAFIFGYGEWLSHIPPQIDYALFASIALAVVSLFPIRTLLKEADQIFLLPFERHMKNYINASLFYSYISRISLPFILLIVFFPLFYKLSHNHYGFYIAFSISTLLYPYLVLLIKWAMG